MANVLLFILQQWFDPFTMLPFGGSSQTGLFRDFPNHIFWSPYFRKCISYEGHLFLKMFEI